MDQPVIRPNKGMAMIMNSQTRTRKTLLARLGLAALLACAPGFAPRAAETATAQPAAAKIQPAAADPSRPAPARPVLADQTRIRRTSYGVPHITANSERALGFGFGFAQAEDHCESIMELIIKARGEAAKVFGGDENIESDFWNHQFRVRARAVETYHKLDADFRELTEGFAAGFNYFVELNRAALPAWVGPVTAHDVAAHGQMGVMRFAFDRGGVIRAFLAKRGKTTAMAGPEEMDADRAAAADAFGSNMWAFAPERSESGKAMLMGNPHQPWSKVATYYEAHLTLPGKLDFYGSTFVGRPVLTAGWNERLGWSHTVNYADLEEIYELTLAPGRADRYVFDGGEVPITKETATIEVKGGEGASTLTREFEYTPLGPVILREEGRVFVLRSAMYDEYRFYEQWYRMGQARTFKEFRAALDMLAVPMFNICYADAEGNIFYIWNGTVPKLPHAAHFAEAVPALGSRDVWTAVHPVADLPQLFNPKGGYVQNSNSPPYLTNLNEPMDPAKFPAYFGENSLGLRTQHSLELVHNDTRFTLEQVRDMKFSMRMLLADRVKPALLQAVRAANPTPEDARALELLEKWDNTDSAESRGSVLFKTWWDRYEGAIKRKGAEPNEFPWSAADPMNTPRGLADAGAAADAFHWAVDATRRDHCALDVPWGDVHRVRRGSVDLSVGGGSGYDGNFRVLDFRRAEDGKEVVVGGDGWVFAVEFGPTAPRAYSVLGYSESEVEGSQNFNDQTVLFAQNKMKKVAFTDAEIEADTKRAYNPGR